MTNRASIWLAAGLMLTAVPAWAATITSNSSTIGFATSSTDLINGLAPTSISGTGDQEGLNTDSSGAALTNGQSAAAGLVASPGPNPDLTIMNNGAQVTYTLPASPNGYDISEIDTYSAWRDAGRVNQDYTILYTTTTNPTFTALTNVSQAYSGSSPSALQVLVTGVGLTNVTAIQFSFPSTQNGFVGYRELDVFGTASPPVPEPGTVVLFGLGALGLVGFGRFRRAA